MSNPRQFEAVLFDLGDTLIYFDDDWPELFRLGRLKLLNSLQGSGLAVGNEFLEDFTNRMLIYFDERNSEFIEYTTQAVLKRVLSDWGFADVPEQTQLKALAEMYAVTQAHWVPESDALPTLHELKMRGYRMALISNAADDPNTQALVDKLGARSYFEVTMSSAAAGIRKPNPRIFLSVLESMRVKPERAVMVGDTLGADILGARNAGIFSIWITRHADTPANRAHLETVQPDSSIKTLGELPGLLQRLAE